MKYEKQAYKRILKNELRYERKILSILNDALAQIAGEMAKIYDKYAKGGKLTKAEMTRYNRYASMEKSIFASINDSMRLSWREFERMLPEQYNESFFNYAWAMDNANGVRLNYGVVSKDLLSELNQNPWIVSAKERYYIAGKTQMRNALYAGLDIGKSYPGMYRDIKDAVNRLKYEIIRVLRTEGQSVVNAAQTDLYTRAVKAGIKGNQVWDATLDSRTRPTHQQMDGVKKSTDGYYHGAIGKAPYPVWEGLPAGERINCRCHERFEVEGYSPLIRRTRDQGIIPNQTYTDWKKNYGGK